VGGQMADILAEGTKGKDVDLPGIHRRKTGRLFVASAVMGGLSADAGEKELAALREYGAALGFAFQIAQVYAWRGEKDQAFAWLDRAYEARSAFLITRILGCPNYDPLRSDPRFEVLLRKIGFKK